MGDAGGDGAPLQAVALQVAQPDMTGIVVALHHGDLQNIVFGADGFGPAAVLGDDLAGDKADDRQLAGLQPVGGNGRQVEGIVRLLRKEGIDGGCFEGQHLAVGINAAAALVDLLDLEAAEVIKDHDISQVAGGDGALVVHQEVAGGVVAGHLDGDNGIDAAGDRFPDDVIDVAALQQIQRVLIIGGEHTPGIILLVQKRQQRPQVFGGGALPDHDELAEPQLFQRVLAAAAFVVGVDTGGNIGVEVGAGKLRGVAVDLFVVGLAGQDLADNVGVAVDDTDVVHHLRQPQHAGVVVQRVDGGIIETVAAFIQRGGRNAAGQHKVNVNGQSLGGLQHIADAFHPHHVGDLVWVGDDGGGAVPHHGPGKFGGGDQAAFQVDVGVDQAGGDEPAGNVDLGMSAVLPHPGDEAVRHGDIAMTEIVAEHVKVGGVFENDVGFFFAARHPDEAQLFGQFAGDFIGNAFLWFHKCVSPCSADYFLTIIAKSGPGSKPKNIQIFSVDRKKNDSPPKRSSSAGGGQGKEGSFRFSLR